MLDDRPPRFPMLATVWAARAHLVLQPSAGFARNPTSALPDRVFEFLGHPIQHIHMATINPGQVRGNHYHLLKREVVAVYVDDRVTIAWDEGPSTGVQRREVAGPSLCILLAEANCSHAVKNTGETPVLIASLAPRRYEREAPDAHRREVIV